MTFLPQLRPLIHPMCLPLGTRNHCYVLKKKSEPLQPPVILSERHIGHLSVRFASRPGCLPSSRSVSWVARRDGLLLAVNMGFFWGQVGLSGCVKWFIRPARADVQQATQIVSCHFCFDEESQTSGWGWKGGGSGGQNKRGRSTRWRFVPPQSFCSDVDEAPRSATLLNELASFPLTL